jgi:hypothetical protein
MYPRRGLRDRHYSLSVSVFILLTGLQEMDGLSVPHAPTILYCAARGPMPWGQGLNLPQLGAEINLLSLQVEFMSDTCVKYIGSIIESMCFKYNRKLTDAEMRVSRYRVLFHSVLWLRTP